jgi:hypothetical protein
MLEKLSKIMLDFETVNIKDQIDSVNDILKKAGVAYAIDKITFKELGDCVCLEYGIIGYDTHCTPDGKCTQTPIYGCKVIDCTK